jgi:FkbM family methyltransferase
MRIADRDVGQMLLAPFQARHYRALRQMRRVCPDFLDCFRRYLTNGGSYPHTLPLRTPLGIVTPTLYSYHDLLTVNEVFCREDYQMGSDIRCVVDIGANIGLSALYFLTRHADVRAYLWEPVEENQVKLRQNLHQFETRYELFGEAVGDRAGIVEFGIEPTGRYGGIGRPTGTTLSIPCRHINDVLTDILSREPQIDVLKLDTEGLEAATVAAIAPELLPRIKLLLYEDVVGGISIVRRKTPLQ